MADGRRSFGHLVKFFSTCTLAVILGAIGPWLQAFFDLKLISDYFQPWANAASSALAALAFFATFALSRRRARYVLERTLKISLWLVAVGIVVCLVFKLALGVVLVPSRVGTILAWLFWFSAYVLFFVNLSISLCREAQAGGLIAVAWSAPRLCKADDPAD